MKWTGLEVFDSTIQRTNSWLKDFMEELNWTDRRKSYLTLRWVLHVIRHSMTVENAAYFGDQLPMLLRGLFFEHWKPEGRPLPERSREEFLANEVIFRALFRMLERKISEGEIEEVYQALPRGLQELWPPRSRAA
ncbi:MAG: DUF2267 domain-containing protein [Acidobacteria bacterium]|nr:DUF2267 domain-containing protein [Acidobacteriota bacterium]